LLFLAKLFYNEKNLVNSKCIYWNVSQYVIFAQLSKHNF